MLNKKKREKKVGNGTKRTFCKVLFFHDMLLKGEVKTLLTSD